MTPIRRLTCALLAVVCAARGSPRAARSRSRPARGQAASRLRVDARLLPQRRPRRALRGAGARASSGAPGSTSRSQTPSDPSAPLKLLAAGKVDLAISYEPELLLARDKGLKLVSVGALVQRPLTSIISLGRKAVATPRELARQDGRHRGHPVPVGLPEDDPRRRPASTPAARQGGQRRLQPRPGDAVGQGRRDARRLLELRGRSSSRQQRKHPKIIRIDDGRRADLQRARDRRPRRTSSTRRRRGSAALPAGARARARGAARRTRQPASTPLLQANPDLDRAPAGGERQGDAAGVLPGRHAKPFGWQDPAEWARLRRAGCATTGSSRSRRRRRAR